MMLSKYFSLEEMTRSELAIRNDIDNSPPPDVLENLKMLCQRVDRLRDVLAVPILPSSGYRCEAVERILCAGEYSLWCKRKQKSLDEASWQEYFARKAHPKGLAMDFTAPAYAPVRDVFVYVRNQLIGWDFDQLILEYDRWVHLGYSIGSGRKQVLRITKHGTEVLA